METIEGFRGLLDIIDKFGVLALTVIFAYLLLSRRLITKGEHEAALAAKDKEIADWKGIAKPTLDATTEALVAALRERRRDG